MKVLGALLREMRKELDLTIQDVADKLDLKYGTVANMESGGKKPTLEQLNQYAVMFGIDNGIALLSLVLADLNLMDTDSEEFRTEFREYGKYFDEIKEEFYEKRASEDLKINIDIDAAIDIIIKRYTTKESTPVNPKEIIFLREEIKSIIQVRANHLLSR